MGKDSLLKSTSKKKSKAKKDAEAKKVKKAAKATSKTTVKPSPKAKTTKAKKAAPKKAAVNKPSAPKTKKSTAKAKPKKVTVQELIARKFEVRTPDKLFSVQPADRSKAVKSAPPIIAASDPAEAARLKELLLKKFDWTQLKAAAEKASAEKAATEKAATEKAAAEKASAEKAATEKAAAQKAAAEKADAEKAAAEKAAEAEPEASIGFQPPADSTPSDPTDKMMKYGIAGFILLVLLVIGASAMNTGNYYIKPIDGATEIWQGKFAPKGDRLLISLPGLVYTDPVQESYSKEDVFPLIFSYFIEKADTLLDVPGLPDFEGVKAYLNQALAYATTEKLAANARGRLDTIQLMVLLYKADVAVSKDTIEGLESALRLLKEASGLDADALQKERIIQKTAAATARLEALKAEAANAEAEAKAAESESPETAEEEHPVD